MKKTFAFFLLLVCFSFIAYGQTRVKAVIRLKDGKTIDVYHFGKLVCELNRYSETYTILRGKYQDSHTEIIDYKDINKLVLSGFNAPPVSSTGNQKGKITVVKKNGVSVPLEEAELALSCFSPSDKYNEIHVQILNPLTEKAVDLAIEMRKIESISF